MEQLALIILILPLVSFLGIQFIPIGGGRPAAVTGTSIIGIALILSIMVFLQVWGQDAVRSGVEWFSLPMISVSAGVLLNNESVLMMVTVNLVSFLVHLYSTEYMGEDPGIRRYFAFLGLFTFSMLGIVIFDNLLLIFMFWELVGFSSYLMIGFWYRKPSAAQAGKKAFIVNRIGDFGFMIGILMLVLFFGTLNLDGLSSGISTTNIVEGSWVMGDGELGSLWVTVAGICLLGGVLGKSAQFPLQVWLPDAMEGPTPVSALIHAATMVAAGIYLLARIFFLLNAEVLVVIAFIGAITAFMGAVAALTQHDVKRVLAFSTISQLGYMVMGMGVGAYGAALFHLTTHAFFKACLFLAAGSIIHHMHQLSHNSEKEFDVQDMRNLGGLMKKLPITFWTFLIATLALAGLPFFSGFLSKEAILVAANGWGHEHKLGYLVFDIGLVTAFLTAFYMGRALMLVFWGEFRTGGIESSFESLREKSLALKIPLLILATGSLGVFFSLNPLSFEQSWILNTLHAPASVFVQEAGHGGGSHFWVTVGATGVAILGLVAAYFTFRPTTKYSREYASAPDEPTDYYGKLSFRNWFLDWIYHYSVVKGHELFSNACSWVDRNVIDWFIDRLAKLQVIVAHVAGWIDEFIVDGLVDLSASVSRQIGGVTRSLQNGKVQDYFIWSVMGLLILILWIVL